MIVSTLPLASAAGLRILQQGGNAVDAAVGIAAVLQVTKSCSAGLSRVVGSYTVVVDKVGRGEQQGERR